MNNAEHLKHYAAPRREEVNSVGLWFCLGIRCAPKEWFVHHLTSQRGPWTVTDGTGSLYTVAADIPVCPECGDDLHQAALTEKSP